MRKQPFLLVSECNDCAGVTENRSAPKSQGFVVALYRSADDDAQMALFPAEHLDAAEDWLVQMAQYDGYEVSDFNELRALETRELFSVDIFDGKPGGRMQPATTRLAPANPTLKPTTKTVSLSTVCPNSHPKGGNTPCLSPNLTT